MVRVLEPCLSLFSITSAVQGRLLLDRSSAFTSSVSSGLKRPRGTHPSRTVLRSSWWEGSGAPSPLRSGDSSLLDEDIDEDGIVETVFGASAKDLKTGAQAEASPKKKAQSGFTGKSDDSSKKVSSFLREIESAETDDETERRLAAFRAHSPVPSPELDLQETTVRSSGPTTGRGRPSANEGKEDREGERVTAAGTLRERAAESVHQLQEQRDSVASKEKKDFVITARGKRIPMKEMSEYFVKQTNVEPILSAVEDIGSQLDAEALTSALFGVGAVVSQITAKEDLFPVFLDPRLPSLVHRVKRQRMDLEDNLTFTTHITAATAKLIGTAKAAEVLPTVQRDPKLHEKRAHAFELVQGLEDLLEAQMRSLTEALKSSPEKFDSDALVQLLFVHAELSIGKSDLLPQIIDRLFSEDIIPTFTPMQIVVLFRACALLNPVSEESRTKLSNFLVLMMDSMVLSPTDRKLAISRDEKGELIDNPLYGTRLSRDGQTIEGPQGMTLPAHPFSPVEITLILESMSDGGILQVPALCEKLLWEVMGRDGRDNRLQGLEDSPFLSFLASATNLGIVHQDKERQEILKDELKKRILGGAETKDMVLSQPVLCSALEVMVHLFWGMNIDEEGRPADEEMQLVVRRMLEVASSERNIQRSSVQDFCRLLFAFAHYRIDIDDGFTVTQLCNVVASKMVVDGDKIEARDFSKFLRSLALLRPEGERFQEVLRELAGSMQRNKIAEKCGIAEIATILVSFKSLGIRDEALCEELRKCGEARKSEAQEMLEAAKQAGVPLPPGVDAGTELDWSFLDPEFMDKPLEEGPSFFSMQH